MEFDRTPKTIVGTTPRHPCGRHVFAAPARLTARLPAGLLAVATAFAAVATSTVVPASAATVAPWGTPVTISTPRGAVGPVGITGTNTSSVAWWRWQDGAHPGAAFGAAFAARPAGAQAFGLERSRTSGSRTSEELISLDIQGYGAKRLIALSQVLGRGPVREGRANPPDRVLVATGTTAGLRTPITLARANLVGTAQLAMASSGRGIVAFASFDPKIPHRAIVSAAIRSPSHQFSKPEVISGRGEAHGVVVAIGRRGDIVVAFVRNKEVMARVRRPGHGWGAIQTLATANGPTQWTLRTAVSDAGSVQVLWQRRFVSDREDGSALQARRMAPGASRWGARITIEAGGANAPSSLVSVPGGFAVGYTVRSTVPGSRSTARVSLLKPRASTKLDVAPALGGVRDVRLARSDRHGLLATMVMSPPAGDSVGVGVGAFLAPGASGFGPIERVTSADDVQEVVPGFARDGDPLVVWSAPPDGSDPGIPIDSVRRVVRTSTRRAER